MPDAKLNVYHCVPVGDVQKLGIWPPEKIAYEMMMQRLWLVPGMPGTWARAHYNPGTLMVRLAQVSADHQHLIHTGWERERSWNWQYQERMFAASELLRQGFWLDYHSDIWVKVAKNGDGKLIVQAATLSAANPPIAFNPAFEVDPTKPVEPVEPEPDVPGLEIDPEVLARYMELLASMPDIPHQPAPAPASLPPGWIWHG